MKITENIEVFNEDCNNLMARYPDGYFDLAIVDPPYGIEDKISIGGGSHTKSCVKFHQLYSENHKKWDFAPKKEYFDKLFKASKHQIIWGGNYFKLPICRCFIFWDKLVEVPNFSAGEFAWTSFDKPASKVTIRNTVEIMKAMKTRHRIHPTQKPVKLYEWILLNYAKPNDKILDTHGGSLSIAIAVDRVNKNEKMNLTLVASELDKDYFDASIKRFGDYKNQLSIYNEI